MEARTKRRTLEPSHVAGTPAPSKDAHMRTLVYRCLSMASSEVWKPLMAILVRGADSALLEAVRTQAIMSGAWRVPTGPWHHPLLLGRVLSFLDWRTQWTGVERVCRDWRALCMERGGGCPVVRAPRSTTDAHLRLLTRHHRGLTDLDLTRCMDVEDMSYVSAFKGLQHLSMHGCANAGTEWMAGLARLSSLRTLDLNHCEGVTDDGMIHLSGLSQLQSLTLGDCGVGDEQSVITGAGIRCLAGLVCLNTLNMADCNGLTTDGLSQVGKLRYLDRLSLSSFYKRAAVGTTGLVSLPELRFLQIDDKLLSTAVASVSAAVASVSAELPNLVELVLTYGMDSPLHLPSMPRLRVLRLSVPTQWSGKHLPHAATLSTVETFHLHGPVCLDMAKLTRMPHLRSLSLAGGCSLMIPAGWMGLPQLHTLCLATHDMHRGRSLVHLLAGTPNLRHLRLAGRHTRKELQCLVELSKLEALDITHQNAAYATIRNLTRLPRLCTLTLDNAVYLTDREVRNIAEQLTIRTLILKDCDDVTEDAFGAFVGTGLQYLNLTFCRNLTPAARHRLCLRLPRVEIRGCDRYRSLE